MNKWLTENVDSTLTLPLRSRWHLLSSATPDKLDVVSGMASGIVSGLTVTCDANAQTVTVAPGQAVVNGLVCTFTNPTVFSITAVYDADLYYVVLKSVDAVDSAKNSFNKTVWTRNHTMYSLALVPKADYAVSNAQLVLGTIRWEVTTSTVLVAGTAYPMRVLAVYNSLALVDTEAARAAARVGDVVAILALSYPATVGKIAVTLYELQYRADPVSVVVTDSAGHSIVANGMWVDNPAYGSTSTKPKTVACLVNGVTLYPADVDIPSTRVWVPILNTSSDLLAYLTSMPSYVADVIDYTDPAAAETVPEIAAIASAIDTAHRYATGNATSDFPGNPHKLSFNDINASASVPLLSALFDEGFAVYGQTAQGVVGTLTEETVLGGDIKVDWFGFRTGIIGNRYIVTKHVPTSIAYVTNTDSAQEIPHQLVRDTISLGTDFIGGSFTGYVQFAPRLSYSVGDYVTTVVANKPAAASSRLRLWKCIADYVGTTNTITITSDGSMSGTQASCFEELKAPTSVVIGYRYVADTEYEVDPTGGSVVRIRQNTDLAILTQGHVLDPVPAQVTDYAFFNSFSLHSYLDVLVGSMELMLTSDSDVVSSQAICDRAVLSSRTSSKWTASGTGTGNAIPVFATNRQVKLTCVNTPAANLYMPPRGSIAFATTSASNFYGRVKLLYVYGVNADSAAVLNKAGSTHLVLDPAVGPFDTSNAKLVDSDENEIQGSYWEYNEDTQSIYLADSVYRSSTSYAFIRKAYESPRNLTGTLSVTGTKSVTGVSATASVCIRDISRIAAGDSITVSSTDSITGATFTATKTAVIAGTTANVNQFTVTDRLITTAASIVSVFNSDPAFSDAGYGASISNSGGKLYIVFTAPPGAQFNSNASIQVTSIGNGLGVAKSFSGGADHTWSFADLVGMTVTITDAVPRMDCSAYWSVYSTGDLDSGYDENTFYRVGTVDASYYSVTDTKTTQTYTVTVTAADITGELDTLNIGSEFSCTVVVTGADSTGSTVTDTLIVDRSTFADCTDLSVDNGMRWVRMPDQVVTVTSWQITDSVGLGSAELVIIAESGSDAGPCYSLCKLNWSGSAITAIQDTRKIVTSNTRVIADAKSVGDALSHTCTLLGFTGGLT